LSSCSATSQSRRGRLWLLSLQRPSVTRTTLRLPLLR
jgi:hypothetical protein